MEWKNLKENLEEYVKLINQVDKKEVSSNNRNENIIDKER